MFNLCLVSLSLTSVTVFEYANGPAGSSLFELNFPWCITIDSDKSMLITDMNSIRVLRVYPNQTSGVVVASSGTWLQPRRAVYDKNLVDLFVIDGHFCLMTQYHNGSLTPSTLFGSTCGASTTQFESAASFCMDLSDNFYIVDNFNHRIMPWNATSVVGILLAGETGVSGNDSLHLFNPQDITLDEDNGFYYVTDTFNHRILRYLLGSAVSTVVTDGNGAGIGANQLNEPCGIYLSKNTSTFYIADAANNRIVRWCLGQSAGMTIAGDCNGMADTASSLLNAPLTLTMDSSE
ncbi:unnamed protein product [Adineta ricciae]|uniref:Uncharacterized protein n=1 Tax=Adineta ricciae TaxID=249248 RepID=A0A813SPJ3_ADIRI|nr:unnamed protein product [Adineta ricciae]